MHYRNDNIFVWLVIYARSKKKKKKINSTKKLENNNLNHKLIKKKYNPDKGKKLGVKLKL